MDPSNSRFPFPPYPRGWFLISWSDEITAGKAKPRRCLGREFAVYRQRNGTACILDAYCPHLGAHLGVGGRVVDDCLECAFHQWRFNGQGTCVSIPYAAKIPKQAAVKSWPVREVNGGIYLYFDVDNQKPTFELPSLPEYNSRDWTRPVRFRERVRTRLQEINENNLDDAHFLALHHYDELPNTIVDDDGPVLRIVQQTRARLLGKPFEAEITTEMYGVGMHVTQVVTSAVRFTIMVMKTPTDEDHVDQRFLIWTKKRIPLADATINRVLAFTVKRNFCADKRIWESKRFQAKPVLCDGDGPIHRFRRWHAQFHQSPASTQTTAG